MAIYKPQYPPHGIFENYIDTQRCQGHTTEGGPLPAYLLTRKFEETPDTFDAHAYYDYSRRTIADFRPDPPTQESEMPRDTRPRSQASLNLRLHGSLSGADPANHPEMFMGFLDQDTRVAGDGNVPIARLQEQMRMRGAHYLKPSEPRDATHLTEAITEGLEPETRRYEKLQEARARVRRNLHMFGRTIENPGSASVMDWRQPCAPSAAQTSESGAGSGLARADTLLRAQVRAEFTVGEADARAPVGASATPGDGGAATLAAARACATAGHPDLVRAEDHEMWTVNRYGSVEGARAARLARYKSSGPSEPRADNGIGQSRARGGLTLGALAMDMAKCARQAGSDIEKTRDGDAQVRFLTAERPAGRGAASLIMSATTTDAQRQREIFAPTMRVAGARGRPGAEARIAGGNVRALSDEMEGSDAYMYVDAMLMRMACRAPGTPVEDLIRRKMITDARAPTAAERTLANKLAAQARFRGFDVATIARTTTRDMESGADNAVSRVAHMPNIADGPTAWRTAQAALCETQLVSAPEVQRAPTRDMLHSAIASSTTPLHYAIQGAARSEATARTAGDELADILAPSEGMRTIGSARVMPRATSHKSILVQERIGDA